MVRVVVVGAGVNGVGSALALQRLHPECQITIIAKDFTPNTTGDGAAGLWEPYRRGGGFTPDSKIVEWAGITWQQFSEWYSKGEGKTRGLSLIHGTTLNSVLEPPPSWQHIPLGYASLTPDQCAQFGPRYKSGSRYTTFIAEPSKLLPSLLRDLKALGTRLEVRCLSSLKEAADEADLVINCSGLGARDLVPDPFMFPVRGQVIRVRAPWVNQFHSDEADESFAYIVPNEWAGITWQQFSEWYSKGEGKTRGLSPIHGTTLNSVLEPPPSWQHIPLGYASLTPDQCAQFGPRYKSGFRFTTFTAEPSKLLPSLLRDLKALGTRLEVRCLSSLKEAADEADLVINCSGLGARDLVPDPFVFPVRGQVIRVRAPWVNQFHIDVADESFAYIIPNQDTVVLGGTDQKNNWNLKVDAADSRTIWANCTAHIPSLKSAEVVEEWVGLRPYRSKGVRLEADELQLGNRTIPVVHNYGHGGCGVTLFWGCSQEVARLASRLILRHHGPASKL
ncbi:D-aspartate oxidase [Chionoecetes opilio]|uniref:D-aspartate oxidase n=1 Tax=Chionoecetes opilio TaxID=41210 RepID=A0A8J8WDF6_CHIOP|nr:D-aspartate oxidase [Chionoecetes opilio]